MFNKDSKTINVEGAKLSAKLESVLSQRRNEAGRYWVSYTFPLRPNVALEAVLSNANGSETKLGVITGAGPSDSTTRAGLFLLYDEKSDLNRPVRAELFDLDRPHSLSGPVYTLGHIDASQSLEFLERLIEASSDAELCGRLVESAAVHDDLTAESLLKKWARDLSLVEARMVAIRWLGRISGHLDFLSEVAAARDENQRVRVQAIISIGKSTEPEAAGTLGKLYETIEETALKMYVISALSKQHHRSVAAGLLHDISESEADDALKLHSRAKLDKTGGKKKLKRAKVNPFLKRFKKKAGGLSIL